MLSFIPTKVVGIFRVEPGAWWYCSYGWLIKQWCCSSARLLISHPCGWPGNKATNLLFCNYSIQISSVGLTCMLGADHIHSGTSSFRAYIRTWHDYQRCGYIDKTWAWFNNFPGPTAKNETRDFHIITSSFYLHKIHEFPCHVINIVEHDLWKHQMTHYKSDRSLRQKNIKHATWFSFYGRRFRVNVNVIWQ